MTFENVVEFIIAVGFLVCLIVHIIAPRPFPYLTQLILLMIACVYAFQIFFFSLKKEKVKEEKI